MTERERLLDRLFNDPTRRIQNFHVDRGERDCSVEELCGEINKALDQVDNGTAVPGYPETGLPRRHVDDIIREAATCAPRSHYLAKCKRLRTDGPTPCLCCPGVECYGDAPGFTVEEALMNRARPPLLAITSHEDHEALKARRNKGRLRLICLVLVGLALFELHRRGLL